MRSIQILLIAGVLVLAGCGKKESEAEKRNLELQAELTARDQFIAEVTASIHEIHDKLEGKEGHRSEARASSFTSVIT